MKTHRKNYARLGKVSPSNTLINGGVKQWRVKADSKQLQFKALWAREPVSISLGDCLDLALNRNVEYKGKSYQFAVSERGIHLRETGCVHDLILSFDELLGLFHGNSLLGVIA